MYRRYNYANRERGIWPNLRSGALFAFVSANCMYLLCLCYGVLLPRNALSTWSGANYEDFLQLKPSAMPPSVRYHCPCLSNSPFPPPPHLASSSYSFHPLHELFFCEECDAVRCNRCVTVEVSSYYCPNCLFEVPSASVRAEKNR